MSRVIYRVRRDALPTPESHMIGRFVSYEEFVWRHGGGRVHRRAEVHSRAFIGQAASVGSSARLGKNTSVEDRALADGYMMGHAILRGAARTEPGSRITSGHVVIGGCVVVGCGTTLSGRMCIDGNVHLEGVSISGDDLSIIGGDQHNPLIIDRNVLPEPITLGPGWVITDLMTLRLLAMAMDSQYELGRNFAEPAH